MIFSELYSAYYNAVAAVLAAVIAGEADEKALRKIVSRYAFSDSALTILPSLKAEKWKLVKSDMSTPIKNPPSMPLTLLERRWLKAISLEGCLILKLRGLRTLSPCLHRMIIIFMINMLTETPILMRHMCAALR